MQGIENYFGFVIAGILLNITPGNDTVYVLTRSIAQGKKAGIYSVLGISAGCLVHILFAALGLSTILSTSAFAFSIVKYVGVVYLTYLGIKMIIDKSSLDINLSENSTEQNFKTFYQGALTNIFNPKVALFFLSFLPQFINTDVASNAFPFLILGLTFLTTGTLWCLFLAYSASFLSSRLNKNKNIEKYLKKISGLVFILLGIKLALTKN